MQTADEPVCGKDGDDVSSKRDYTEGSSRDPVRYESAADPTE